MTSPPAHDPPLRPLRPDDFTSTARAVIELLVELEVPAILAGELALRVYLGEPTRAAAIVWLPQDLEVVAAVVHEARRRGLHPDDGEELAAWLVAGPNGTTLGAPGSLGGDTVDLTCTTGTLDFAVAWRRARRGVTPLPVLDLADLVAVTREVEFYASAAQRAALEVYWAAARRVRSGRSS